MQVKEFEVSKYSFYKSLNLALFFFQKQLLFYYLCRI